MPAEADDSRPIVVSTGFHRLHLPIAAREASDRGLLALLITSLYPSPRLLRVLALARVPVRGRLGRMLDRGAGVPADRLRPIFTPELLDELARLLARLPLLGRLYSRAAVACGRLYGWRAGRALKRAPGARLLHYRAGYGGASVEAARRRGMVALCDHAIAHPSLLEELVTNRGRPRNAVLGERPSHPIEPPADPFWRAVLDDIDRADAVLVNSDFVKQTMITAGWPAERVHVVYLGIDDNFLQLGGKTAPRRPDQDPSLPLLFASRFERRKGAETMIEALGRLEGRVDWRLIVAGPAEDEIRRQHPGFFEDERVTVLGPLARPQFKEQLLANPVFVFPTYAEGSARAVFEALACGCYAITTPNAGSIVEDGVHGALVPPGDAEALAEAIADADRDRARVAEVGNRNATLIADSHRQGSYGEEVVAVYRRLIGGAAQEQRASSVG